MIAGPNHARLAPYSAVVFGDHTMHDLLSLDTDDAAELFEGAQAYIDETRRTRSAPYWMVIQNGGQRAASSVDHAHLQVLGRADCHFAEPARVAVLGSPDHWQTAAEVHHQIGLGVDVGSRGTAFATLVPVKERDFTVLTRGSLVDGVRAVWPLVRALISWGTSSWSLAALPNPRQFGADVEPYRAWPDVVWRFVDRGRLGHPVGDMGTMELFGTTVVATDPLRGGRSPALGVRPGGRPVDVSGDRPGADSWAQNAANVEALGTGDLLAVTPQTLEVAPTDQDDRAGAIVEGDTGGRRARKGPGPDPDGDDVSRHRRGPGPDPDGADDVRRHRKGPGSDPDGDDVHTLRRETAKLVLRKAADAGVTGVLWAGAGEPLLFDPLVECLRYARSLGMVGAVHTNGLRLGVDARLARELLDPATALVVVRVSVDAAPAATRRRGLPATDDARLQLEGLRRLLRARRDLVPRPFGAHRPPAIQVSTLVDATNVEDLEAICDAVATVIEDVGSRPHRHDALVVRPVVVHPRRPAARSASSTATATAGAGAAGDGLVGRVLACCRPGGVGQQRLAQVGLPVRLGGGLDRVEAGLVPSYRAVLAEEYRSRTYAWAHGLFLTVGPDGLVYFSTEKIGDRRWAFGDLKSDDVASAYTGPRRRALLQLVHSARMGPAVLPPHTRMGRLNRIASQLQDGGISPADVERIREASLSSPPLLLS